MCAQQKNAGTGAFTRARDWLPGQQPFVLYALLVFALENTRYLTPKQCIRMPTTSVA